MLHIQNDIVINNDQNVIIIHVSRHSTLILLSICLDFDCTQYEYRLFPLPQQLWWLTLNKPWVTYLFWTGGLSAPVSGVGGGTDRLTLTQLSQQRSTTSGECSFDLELGASATKVNQRLQEKQRDTAAANRKQYNKLQAIHRIAAGQ